jgi:hypothetical protein
MIPIMLNVKRALGLISDVHIGCPAAPWPEEVYTRKEERLIPPSEKQRIINKHFDSFCDDLDDYHVDTIVLLGDLIHGNNRKEWGRETMTPDLNVQQDACIQFLGRATKDRTVVGVSGTGYHNSLDILTERRVIQNLGGTYLEYLANFPVKGTGHIAQILHGASGAVIYREMAMARESLFLDAAEGSGKIPFHISLRITGHWHYFSVLRTENRTLIQLPGWTDWTPWVGALKTYGKMLPHIGGVILLIDDKDRLIIIDRLFQRPLISDRLLEPH